MPPVHGITSGHYHVLKLIKTNPVSKMKIPGRSAGVPKVQSKSRSGAGAGTLFSGYNGCQVCRRTNRIVSPSLTKRLEEMMGGVDVSLMVDRVGSKKSPGTDILHT